MQRAAEVVPGEELRRPRLRALRLEQRLDHDRDQELRVVPGERRARIAAGRGVEQRADFRIERGEIGGLGPVLGPFPEHAPLDEVALDPEERSFAAGGLAQPLQIPFHAEEPSEKPRHLRAGQREYDVHPGGIAAEGLYFVTRISKATVALWNQMMQGLPPMPKAILSCRRPGRQEEDFLIITMEQVDVARIKTMDTGEDDPTPICLVHLVFDLHRMDYREHKADGSASGKHAAGYDYKQHKAV